MSPRPAWPAYVLTLLAAGIGHWYLGHWKRGAIWLGTYALAVAFLSARSLSAAFDPGSPFIVTALGVEQVSYVEIAVPLAVLVVCLLDVSLQALAREVGPVEVE